LNYCYRLAEIETTIALRAVGLDPSLGITHTDKRDRDSMTLDCLEAIRPTVDAYVLQLIRSRTFRRSDFHELPDGTIRILPPLSHELAQTLPQWRTTIAPVVEQIANMLRPANAVGRKVVRTPLTNANIRVSQAEVKSRRLKPVSAVVHDGAVPTTWSEIHAIVRQAPTELLMKGTGLSNRYIRRIRSGDRIPDAQHWTPLYQAAIGTLPETEGESSISSRLADYPKSLVWEEILPAIQACPASTLAEATGLTTDYIYKVKRQVHRPHVRHWPTLYHAATRKTGDT